MIFSDIDNDEKLVFNIYKRQSVGSSRAKVIGWGDKKKKLIDCLPEYVSEISELFPEYSVKVYAVKEKMIDFLKEIYGDGTEEESIAKNFWLPLIDAPGGDIGSILRSFILFFK